MTPTAKELLAFHLDHTFEKEAGHPPLAQAVAGLTAAQAAWKPSPARHSIWQITRHVAHWKDAFLLALDGRAVEYDEWNRRDWQEVAGTQEEWERDVARLHAVSGEMRKRLEALEDAQLGESFKLFAKSRSLPPVAMSFLEMATHDTYHAGQIQALFALQEIPVEELTAAASRDDLPRMERILSANPAVAGEFSRDGWTALHVASYFGMVNAVRLLLSRGASPTARSHNDRRAVPLHLAVRGLANRAEIVGLLMRAGADASAVDAGGKTAREEAASRGDPAVVAALEARVP